MSNMLMGGVAKSVYLLRIGGCMETLLGRWCRSVDGGACNTVGIKSSMILTRGDPTFAVKGRDSR